MSEDFHVDCSIRRGGARRCAARLHSRRPRRFRRLGPFGSRQRLGIGKRTASAASAAPQQLQRVEIRATRQRLDAARNGLSPDTGSSIYRFSGQDIQNLPLGDSTPLNQVILRSPGVVQDSYGQLHVRGDHANVQYRIDVASSLRKRSAASARRLKRASQTE